MKPFGRRPVLAVASLLFVAACSVHTAVTVPAAPAQAANPLERSAGAGCPATFYAPAGARTFERRPLHGPGIVLGGGGTDVDAEFVWIHDTIAGSSVRGGDLVVLRATGNNDYDPYIFGLARYHSVRTLLVPPCASSKTIAAAAAIARRAGAIFFAGGNQADYVAWQGTPLQAAVQSVYDRGGVVGGTSAGEAILGAFVFDARNVGSGDVNTSDAVRHPFEPSISFTYGFLRFPALKGTIDDQHFVTRNRFGRLAVFMARQIVRNGSAAVRGIGVDEASGLVVDKRGVATLLLQGKGGAAYFVLGGPARRMMPHQPFVSARLEVTRLHRTGETFDLAAWCARPATYGVVVNGTVPGFYRPADPYTPSAGSPSVACRKEWR